MVGSQSIPHNFENLPYKDSFPVCHEQRSMYLSPVLYEDVNKAVLTLRNGKAPEIDGMNSFLVKKIFPKIIDVFTFIINLSFKMGVFPDSLKHAVVIPVYKNGPLTSC